MRARAQRFSSSAEALPPPLLFRSAGVVWGSLLCLSVLLVAQSVVDSLPDTISGLWTVSQVMARCASALSLRHSREEEEEEEVPTMTTGWGFFL